MAQKIEKLGDLIVTSEKRVIFKSRQLKDIVATEGENIAIRYTNIAEEGEQIETLIIPFEKFAENAELAIWQLVDEYLNEVE